MHCAINIIGNLCYNITMISEKDPVIFPEHFGFCEGVKAADTLLRDVTGMARELGINKVYGYHGIVHNDEVIRDHTKNGVQFVEDLSEIPDQSVVITSAHGVGPEIVKALDEKKCTRFEAACPLVLHTQRAVQKARRENEKVIYVCKGKPGVDEKLHDEVKGIVGHLDYVLKDGVLTYDPLERSYLGLNEALADDLLSVDKTGYRIVTQTTLNADEALRYRKEIEEYITNRQPNASVSMATVNDVCSAVSDRQKSVAELVGMRPERIVVATDSGSKNGMGYKALALSMVADSGQETSVYNIATAEEAKRLGKIKGVTALTASASTPDSTTFAIAEELGATRIPKVERHSFKLRDADTDEMFRKLFRHAQMAEGLEA